MKLKVGDCVKLLYGSHGHSTGDVGIITEIDDNVYIVEVRGRVSVSSHKPGVAYYYSDLQKVEISWKERMKNGT